MNSSAKFSLNIMDRRCLILILGLTCAIANEDYNEIDNQVISRERRAINFYRTGHKLQSEMSKTLDLLLGPNYNKRIRPDYGGKPVHVELNLSIRAVGPINEKSQDFFIDCYFRQSWTDNRLVFNTTGGVNELPMNWQFLNKIWKPDTFFVNGKKSKIHKITVPNKFLRITPDGKVSYSQRLTIHARCRMHLFKFPFDSQLCPLWIGSYGYASKDVIFQWRHTGAISIGELQTAQFLITKVENGVINNTTMRLIESGFRNDSVAWIHFSLERQSGFFLLQHYTPLLVIVMCSWVAFWIVKTDAPARCALGITTVLSVIKIGFGGKGKPQVGYPTAMDVFVVICLGTVFAALCEFAIVNFISVTMGRYRAEQDKIKEEADKAKELLDEAQNVIEKIEEKWPRKSSPKTNNGTNGHRLDHIPMIEINKDDDLHDDLDLNDDVQINPFGDEVDTPSRKSRKSIETMDASTATDDFYKQTIMKPPFDWHEKAAKCQSCFIHVFQLLTTRPNWLRFKPVVEMYMYKNTEECLDDIDDYCKMYFPLGFLVMMAIYWTLYLYIIEDVLVMDSF